MEHPVTIVLKHTGMRIEARIAKLGNLLGQQLDTVCGVTEDNGLVDLKLVEESVQAVHLLLLFDESVVLCDTAQRQLVHQVDLVRRVHMLVLEVLNDDGEGSAEQHHLPILRMKSEQLLDDGRELRRQKLVSFIHDKRLTSGKIGYTLARKIQDSTGCSNDDVDRVAESDDIVLKSCSTGRNHDVDTEMLSQGLADLRCLKSQLSGGYEDERLCLGVLRVHAFESGNDESRGLSGAILRSRKNVSSCESDGNSLLLNWRRLLEACLEDAHHELTLDKEVLELEAFRRSYILRPNVSLRIHVKRSKTLVDRTLPFL